MRVTSTPTPSIIPPRGSALPEAISFSTGEVVAILLILAAMAAAVLLVVVLGIIGFHRIGLGRTDSLLARIAWPIGLIDIGIVLGGFRDAWFIVVLPLLVHLGAFALGRARSTPPDSPPPPTQPAPPPAN